MQTLFSGQDSTANSRKRSQNSPYSGLVNEGNENDHGKEGNASLPGSNIASRRGRKARKKSGIGLAINGNGLNGGDGKNSNDDGLDNGDFFKVGAQVYCRCHVDGTFRLCTIIERNIHNEGKRVDYYVHFAELNRRMDAWVSGDDTYEKHPDGIEHKSDVVEYVEEDYGDSNEMNEDSIREHEEITKVKTVNTIELGRHIIQTWYYSPIPREFTVDGFVDVLYISAFTLDMFKTRNELARHYQRCKIRHPPGDEIYRDVDNKISMWEVDGAKSKIYAQNLCYLAKFFLDHKTLHYDVDPFLFYLLCEFDETGYHVAGYFSKEKYSEEGYNLACILTLPPYQRRGYGNFLISFSYKLSQIEKRVGSPEKPLSDLGQISYRSYWCSAVLETLLRIDGDRVSVTELAILTSIKSEDVVTALKFLGLIKHVNGKYILCADPVALRQKLTALKRRGPIVDRDKLHWAPLKVDVKRDKWTIKSKRKIESNFDDEESLQS